MGVGDKVDVRVSPSANANERYDILKAKYGDRLSQVTQKLFNSSGILAQKQGDQNTFFYSIKLLEDALYMPELVETFKNNIEPAKNRNNLIALLTNSTSKNLNCPTVLLFKVMHTLPSGREEPKIFGGFASCPWSSSGFFGDKNSFLFSFAERQIIFEARDPYPGENLKYQWRNNNFLSFGDRDLVLTGDGTWTSNVGDWYMSSKDLSEEDCKSVLAGSNTFVPDIIEVWALRKDKDSMLNN